MQRATAAIKKRPTASTVPADAIACPPALYELAAGASGHLQDCTARGSTATKAPASAAVVATARPLPGATFSPIHNAQCRGSESGLPGWGHRTRTQESVRQPCI